MRITADLSALGGCSEIPLNLLMCIIAPTADYANEQINLDMCDGRLYK
jgi:hypothetical protein